MGGLCNHLQKPAGSGFVRVRKHFGPAGPGFLKNFENQFHGLGSGFFSRASSLDVIQNGRYAESTLHKTDVMPRVFYTDDELGRHFLILFLLLIFYDTLPIFITEIKSPLADMDDHSRKIGKDDEVKPVFAFP